MLGEALRLFRSCSDDGGNFIISGCLWDRQSTAAWRRNSVTGQMLQVRDGHSFRAKTADDLLQQDQPGLDYMHALVYFERYIFV